MYLARLKALREARDAITERTATGVPGQRAVEWLRALSESIQIADVPKEQADLMHAIYERITVAGHEIVGVRLTAAAYAHGLALALPEKVVMARPTGVERADAINIRIPIEGAAIGPMAEGASSRVIG
jgi:malate/lactate dehydrogenase